MDDSAKLSQLLALRESVEAQLAVQKEALATVNADIVAVAKPLADAVYQREGKTDGTVRFAVGNRIYKAEVRKTVSYDNERLMAVAGSLPWEHAREIFKFKADVPEKAFKAITSEGLKTRIMEARTVKYSDPKITAED